MRIGNRIALGLGLSLLCLLLVGGVSYRTTVKLIRAHRWVTHTQRVMSHLSAAFSTMSDAETGVRGFVITGEDRYLEPFHSAARRGPVILHELASLTSDNPVQYERTRRLKRMAEEQKKTLKDTVALRRGREPWVPLSRIAESKAVMDTVRTLIRAADDYERALLEKRVEAERKSAEMTLFSIATGVLLAAVLSVLSTLVITRSITVPLNQLLGGIHRLGRGKMEARIDVRGSNELGRLAAAFNDMAERRAFAERTMKKWADIFEHAEWGVVVGSADKRELEMMNPAFAKMHGYTVEELTGTPIIDVFAPESRDELDAQLELCHRKGHHTFESRHLRKDGSTFPVLIDMTAVRDDGGKLLYRAVNVQDITALKQAEASIRKARDAAEATTRELEAFSYSVSHDLRTPLRSIDGFSQALLEDCDDKLDDAGRDYLRRIRAAAQRMSQLIDDLLNLARVSRVGVERRGTDLTELANEVASEVQSLYPHRASWKVKPGMSATCDPRLMRVVFQNLLSNAWKFTSKTKNASITFELVDGADDAFVVSDNGAGFDMQYAGKLFGAFQRLHSAQEFSGTGVGLATVQRIIHRHGGRVWAEASPGSGASFYFTLPKDQQTAG